MCFCVFAICVCVSFSVSVRHRHCDGGIMFSGCPSVRACVSACGCASVRTCVLLARRIQINRRNFTMQTFVDDVVEATEELARFWRSRGQSQGRYKVKHLTELLRRAEATTSTFERFKYLVLMGHKPEIMLNKSSWIREKMQLRRRQSEIRLWVLYTSIYIYENVFISATQCAIYNRSICIHIVVITARGDANFFINGEDREWPKHLFGGT